MLLAIFGAITMALAGLSPASDGCSAPGPKDSHQWVPYEQEGALNPDGSPVMGWCWTGGGYWHGQGLKPSYTPPVEPMRPHPILSTLGCHYPGWVNMDADDPVVLAAWGRAYAFWRECRT